MAARPFEAAEIAQWNAPCLLGGQLDHRLIADLRTPALDVALPDQGMKPVLHLLSLRIRPDYAQAEGERGAGRVGVLN